MSQTGFEEQPNAAVLLVAHGERGGAFSNAILLRHAGAVSSLLQSFPIAAGVLSGSPTLEEALTTVAGQTQGPILVFPFFMAAGFFVNVKVPQRIAEAGLAHRCRVLTPLGSAEPLPDVIANRARRHAEALGQPISACRLLLVGHGSKVARASAEATELVAARLREMSGFGTITTAFLEEAPFLKDVVTADQRPTVVVGFFNGDGLHAAEDVPEALGAFDGSIAYTGAVGAFEEVSTLIADAIARAVDEIEAEAAAHSR